VGNRGASRGGGKLGFVAKDLRPKLVIPCRRNRIGVMDDCISMSLRAEYIGVHDLEGKELLLPI